MTTTEIRETPAPKKTRARRNPPQGADAPRARPRADASPNSGIALRDTVTLSVDSNGNCVLNYSATVCGDDDFVGVYINASQPEGDDLDYEYCDDPGNFPYTTSVAAQVGLVAIYWSWNYATSEWVQVATTATLPSTSPGTSVTGAST